MREKIGFVPVPGKDEQKNKEGESKKKKTPEKNEKQNADAESSVKEEKQTDQKQEPSLNDSLTTYARAIAAVAQEAEKGKFKKNQKKIVPGFLPSGPNANPFADAKTLKELSRMKDRELERIEKRNEELVAKGEKESVFDEEWDRALAQYRKRREEIENPPKPGFLLRHQIEDPFGQAQTLQQAEKLWEKEEKKLRERSKASAITGEEMNYNEEWNNLFEKYKIAVEKLKKTKKRKPGFV